jgi:SAM-dependent methyltransferase
MSFEVSAEAYGRFMGRYSEQLAVEFAELAGLAAGQRALDVGAGPGALTAELVKRLGADAVTAVDPSASFIDALRARLPGVDARQASAERLPFPDGWFDAALAQLVVHFMTDPVGGLREMARVTRAGGSVAACVWDHTAGGQGPLAAFWHAALSLDPADHDESALPGAREGHLAELLTSAGLRQVTPGSLTVRVRYATFEEWWEPLTLGVGRAGAHVAGLTEERRTALRDRCRELLPDPPFEISALAWTARGEVASA